MFKNEFPFCERKAGKTCIHKAAPFKTIQKELKLKRKIINSFNSTSSIESFATLPRSFLYSPKLIIFLNKPINLHRMEDRWKLGRRLLHNKITKIKTPYIIIERACKKKIESIPLRQNTKHQRNYISTRVTVNSILKHCTIHSRPVTS